MINKLQLLRPWLLALGLLSCLGNSLAADDNERWYQVELLVFSLNTPEYKESEIWSATPGSIDTQHSAEIMPPMEMTAESVPDSSQSLFFTSVPEESLNLNQIAERLAESPDYHLLVHKAWRQPLQKNALPIPVIIEDVDNEPLLVADQTAEGESSAESPLPEEAPAEEAAANSETMNGGESLQEQPGSAAIDPTAEELLMQALLAEEKAAEQEQALDSRGPQPVALKSAAEDALDSIPVLTVGPPEQLIFGTATLRWKRFLHLAVDMNYRTSAAALAETLDEEAVSSLFPMSIMSGGKQDRSEVAVMKAESELTELKQQVLDFRINESRRVRTGKIYYFDHPLFGVIAHVSNYEPPPEPEKEEPAEAGSKSKALGAD